MTKPTKNRESMSPAITRSANEKRLLERVMELEARNLKLEEKLK